MKGGELINQGSYGCIYKPLLKCNNKKEIEDGKITKAQVLNKFSQKEIEISKKIIDSYPKDYDEHFSPITNTCLDVDMVKIEKEIEKCNAIKDTKKFVLSEMKYEGKTTLGEYLLLKSKSKELLLRELFYSFEKIIESLEKLHEINIIHLDLKENNLIYSNNKERPIIIDFGLSGDLDKIEKTEKDIFFVHAYDYEPWCIDISIITLIVNENLKEITITQSIYEKTIKKTIENYTEVNTSVLKNHKKKYQEKLKNYFKGFINKKFKDVMDELMKNSKTWDIYSILIMYNYFLLNIFQKKSNEELDENLQLFTNMIEDNLYCLPYERKTAKDILVEYKKIKKNLSLKDFSKKIQTTNNINNYLENTITIEKIKSRMQS